MTHIHNALAAGLLIATGQTQYNGHEYSTPSGAAKATKEREKITCRKLILFSVPK